MKFEQFYKNGIFEQFNGPPINKLTHSGYETRSADLLKQLDWQTLQDRWKINKAVYMFKIVNDMEPPYLSQRFVKRDTKHSYTNTP